MSFLKTQMFYLICLTVRVLLLVLLRIQIMAVEVTSEIIPEREASKAICTAGNESELTLSSLSLGLFWLL